MFDWIWGLRALFEEVDNAGGGAAGTTPPPVAPPVPGAAESGSPPTPPDSTGQPTPPSLPGVSPAPGAGQDWESADNPYKKQLDEALQYLGGFRTAAMEQELTKQGLRPEHIQMIIQSEAKAQALEQRLLQLASHPAVRRMAAEQVAKGFSQYGVTPEDLVDAPSVEAMTYVAGKIASIRARDKLRERKESGSDGAENGRSGGGTVDLDKMSSRELFQRSWDKSGKAR